jgi:threonine synthase
VNAPTSSMVCAGCGTVLPVDDPYPFRCPRAGSGDDVDHVVTRILDARGLRWSELVDDDPNPFVRYRRLFHSWHLADRRGMSDDAYVDLVRELDKEVAGVDGTGFEVTPLGLAEELSARMGLTQDGEVWVKDETENVSGSHKARHMMGLLIHLAVVERLGLASGDARGLAIASCGNAALAAAVVARAGDRPLQVFVPTWGDEVVVARLKELGANVSTVPREEGVAGDPTYAALQRAVAAGALPFTCQGTENGLAIEGGMTIGYELASQLDEEGASIDRLAVQVGGGALASAVIQGLSEAADLGALDGLPRIDTVQTMGGHPLQRAYDRLLARILARLEARGDDDRSGVESEVARRFDEPDVQDELAYASAHRSEFMWPWEEEPMSVATGILDDETYDWFAIVRGMLLTQGRPLVVDEETLREANQLARTATGIDVDPTGSAGLAGVLASGVEKDERIAVLLTGKEREGVRGE